MPIFTPLSGHTARIVLQNTGPIAAEFVVKAMVANGQDGSTVGQSGALRLEPGASGGFPAAMTMPGSPGQYALGGEIWGRLAPDAEFALVGGFQDLGEAVSVLGSPSQMITGGDEGIPTGVLIAVAVAAGVGLLVLRKDKRG